MPNKPATTPFGYEHRSEPLLPRRLFYLDNTRMLYGDAQKVAAELIQAVKAVG